jgi:hypothetical protein
MSQTEKFNMNLSRGQDSFNLKGKYLLGGVSLSTSPSTLVILTPLAQLGARANALSSVFSRYRINRLIIRFLATQSLGGNAVLGVVDDATVEGDAPTTPQDVLECRCSAIAMGNETVPVIFNWSPVDRSKWYYTFTGASGSDPRLTVAATLYAASTNTSTVDVEIDFDVTFKGAVDTLSS